MLAGAFRQRCGRRQSGRHQYEVHSRSLRSCCGLHWVMGWVFRSVKVCEGRCFITPAFGSIHFGDMHASFGSSTSEAQPRSRATMRRPRQRGNIIYAAATEDDPGILRRSCVDCGWVTDCFCDTCYAAHRFPFGDNNGRRWAPGQLTPLCERCDGYRGKCHYCLDLWVLRPARLYAASGRAT